MLVSCRLLVWLRFNQFWSRHATLHLAESVGMLVARLVHPFITFWSPSGFELLLLPNCPWLDCSVSGLVCFFFFLRYRCILVGSIFLFLFLWSRTRELSLAYFISNTLEPHFVCFFGNEIFPSLFQVPFKINRQNHAKYYYLGLKMLIFIVGESLEVYICA